jgi:translation initiation factor IF-3
MINTRWACQKLCLESPLQRRGGQVTLALFFRLAHRRATNTDIRYPYVQIVNADGRLDPPQPLSAILASIDHKKSFVQLVADDRPIVKVLSKKETYDKAKALRKAKKNAERSQEDKEIQMTWGVAVGDLEHKINKVKKELEKKHRVNLIFAPKKRQPVPSPQERDEKVNEVLEMLKDIGKESRPRTFLRSLLTLHLEAKASDTTGQ